jgi:hypothetical protein
MAKKEKPLSAVERIAEMKSKGTEVQLPGTDRLIRLRPLDAETLLREAKMPDILTPLVTKSVYEEITDKESRAFLAQNRGAVNEALAHLEAVDFVCEKSIADGTKVKDLTIAEKRWVFRLAMGPAELLVTFRYDEDADVEPVAEVEDVQPVTEPGTKGK